MPKKSLFLLASALWGLPWVSQAMPVEDFATESSTYATYMQELQQVINEGQMIQNQINQLQPLRQNTAGIGGQSWDNANLALNQLASVMAQGQSLAYSSQNTQSQFTSTYPGYSSPATSNYSQDFQTWVQTAQNTLNNALDLLHTSHEQEAAENATNTTLAGQAATATGQMQALQIAGELAAEQVAQTQKLKENIMAQTNAQAVYYAYRTQKDIAQQQSMDAVIQNANVTFPAYQGNPAFGTLPISQQEK